MEVIGVIPARYDSTRLAGKVLADIAGKPMVQRVWERAKQALLLDDLIIACDDQRVMDAAKSFGAKAVMTAKQHTCGTDRICEVVNPLEVNVVINIQGDEPLVHPTMIDTVARALLDDPTVTMATIMKRLDNLDELNDPNVVKVVVDKHFNALYFSRAVIPFCSAQAEVKAPIYYKHIGLYGYTKDFLFIFKNFPRSELEKTERLEQLRVLQEGFRIKVTETKYDTISVDTPEDLAKVAQYFKSHAAD